MKKWNRRYVLFCLLCDLIGVAIDHQLSTRRSGQYSAEVNAPTRVPVIFRCSIEISEYRNTFQAFTSDKMATSTATFMQISCDNWFAISNCHQTCNAGSVDHWLRLATTNYKIIRKSLAVHASMSKSDNANQSFGFSPRHFLALGLIISTKCDNLPMNGNLMRRKMKQNKKQTWNGLTSLREIFMVNLGENLRWFPLKLPLFHTKQSFESISEYYWLGWIRLIANMWQRTPHHLVWTKVQIARLLSVIDQWKTPFVRDAHPVEWPGHLNIQFNSSLCRLFLSVSYFSSIDFWKSYTHSFDWPWFNCILTSKFLK